MKYYHTVISEIESDAIGLHMAGVFAIVKAEVIVDHDPGDRDTPPVIDVSVFPREAEITVLWVGGCFPTFTCHEVTFTLWTHAILVAYMSLWGVDLFDPDLYTMPDNLLSE